MTGPATTLVDTSNGVVNILFAALFMVATIFIVRGGVSEGIERATKTMMPLLLVMLLVLIGLTLPMEGAADGVKAYLQPDFSQIDRELILYALGQSFFSLSLDTTCQQLNPPISVRLNVGEKKTFERRGRSRVFVPF